MKLFRLFKSNRAWILTSHLHKNWFHLGVNVGGWYYFGRHLGSIELLISFCNAIALVGIVCGLTGEKGIGSSGGVYGVIGYLATQQPDLIVFWGPTWWSLWMFYVPIRWFIFGNLMLDIVGWTGRKYPGSYLQHLNMVRCREDNISITAHLCGCIAGILVGVAKLNLV